MRRGQHLLRHSSTVQNVIGLSSAESEYYALTKGGCSGLGLQSLFADWNLKLQLSLHTDSSSAKAIASRRGTGKSTRHIQTRMLWLQERVAAKHLRVVKVASESNPADMLTKALGRSKIEEFCAEIGQTEPCAETLDKESKGVKKTKEVKFAVEAIEMDETVKNRFKDARIARAKNKLKDARIAKIKNESKVEKITMDAYYGLSSANRRNCRKCVRWTIVEPEGINEPLDAIVDGNRSASEGLKSRANGVATSTSLVGRRVS